MNDENKNSINEREEEEGVYNDSDSEYSDIDMNSEDDDEEEGDKEDNDNKTTKLRAAFFLGGHISLPSFFSSSSSSSSFSSSRRGSRRYSSLSSSSSTTLDEPTHTKEKQPESPPSPQKHTEEEEQQQQESSPTSPNDDKSSKKSSSPSSPPKWVMITAPANLPSGYIFMAECDDDKDEEATITFPVTVPPEGYRHGFRYFVPHPSSSLLSQVDDDDDDEDDNEHQNNISKSKRRQQQQRRRRRRITDQDNNNIFKKQQSKHQYPKTGQWRYNLFQCWDIHPLSPVLWLSCLFRPVLLGQIVTRMGLNWCGDPPVIRSNHYYHRVVMMNSSSSSNNSIKRSDEDDKKQPKKKKKRRNRIIEPCQILSTIFIITITLLHYMLYHYATTYLEYQEHQSIDCYLSTGAYVPGSHERDHLRMACEQEKRMYEHRFQRWGVSILFVGGTYVLFMLLVFVKTRRSIREFYGLSSGSGSGSVFGGGCWEDCLVGVFCSCCGLVQMARHTNGVNDVVASGILGGDDDDNDSDGDDDDDHDDVVGAMNNGTSCCTADGLARKRRVLDDDDDGLGFVHYCLGTNVEVV